jgi:NAD(P)-dependent dehydrogenase (short-subunit alcohol dehydrogenase family)
MKTILITGCSSGFGLETARHFLERGWKVVATMRTPDHALLTPSEHLKVLVLDVTDPQSIAEAVAEAGPIDVLVNNAGVGLLSIFEGTSMQTIRANFETNTFAAMAVTHAVLPQFRSQKSGVVINVSSSVTVAPLRMLSIYTASKAAINAFTESLALELTPFNIRVNLVLPGRSPETQFGTNARTQMQHRGVVIPDDYATFAQSVFAGMSGDPSASVTNAADVAETIWRAANDPASPLRLYAGADAVELAEHLTR